MEPVAKVLVFVGVVTAVVGAALLLLSRSTGGAGLPGDVSFGRGNWRVFLPLGTSIVLSLVLSIVLNVLLRIGRR